MYAISKIQIPVNLSGTPFQGHYTTAITISHTLYCLAKHTEVQKQVIDEQRSIFNDDFLRMPTMEDLTKMKYLEAVIKETLRVVPTVPKIGRKLRNNLNMKGDILRYLCYPFFYVIHICIIN